MGTEFTPPPPYLALKERKIALAVSGSIAAYKAAWLASLLVKSGAETQVLMSPGSQKFVTPDLFAALTGRPVFSSLFANDSDEGGVKHIDSARWADMLVVAPASANTIAKIALGIADNAVTVTALTPPRFKLIAPAMESGMYENEVTQSNLKTLAERGWTIIDPTAGRLASGSVGMGRLEEPEVILEHIRRAYAVDGDLAGVRIVVSAGGTREQLDAVRAITNLSSGKMGFAIAEAARDRGAEVTLVSAASDLATPLGVRRVAVNSAEEMLRAVDEHTRDARLLIMAAAPADVRPSRRAEGKLTKDEFSSSRLELEQTTDIIASVNHPNLLKVAFAAEASGDVERAAAKAKAKGALFTVLNDITVPNSGFGSDYNLAQIVRQNGESKALPLLNKVCLGHIILDEVKPSLKQ